MIVTSKHHSLVTAESADRKVTRNSSHFKKLLADDPTTFSSQALEGETMDLDAEDSSPPRFPAPVQESTDPSVDPDGGAEIPIEPAPRRSARVSVPPRRLIQEM